MMQKWMKKGEGRRLLSGFLALVVLVAMIPVVLPAITMPATASVTSAADRVADPSTAGGYKNMLGTDADGNRYAGRVWTDKSVFTDASVTLDGHTVTNNGDFMVVYSALGSSTSVTTSTTSAANLDVVFVLDNSPSMDDDNRLSRVVAASNELLKGLVGTDNRLAVVSFSSDAETVAPLDYYPDLSLSANRQGNVTVTSNGQQIGRTRVYRNGTFTQSGINLGLELLEESAEQGRVPILIVLADGVANGAVTKNWQNVSVNNMVFPSNNTTAGVVLSTLLNASYMKSAVENAYGRNALVYGITVEVAQSQQADAFAVMNPAEYFSSTSASSVARTAYGWFEDWVAVTNNSTVIERTDNWRRWQFEQVNPNNAYGVTKQQVIDNIGYVDQHFTVNNTDDLNFAFESILTTIKTPAFHPTTDTVVQGDSTLEVPLTYVDFIGEYMEVEEINKVVLFGKEYAVTKGNTVVGDPVATADGKVTRSDVTAYTVGAGSANITHPTLGSIFDISKAVRIELTSVTTGVMNGTAYVPQTVAEQTLRVFIESEALPVIVDEITVDVDENGNETIKFTETAGVEPIRVFYTVSMADEVLKNGEIDLSKLDKQYIVDNLVDGKVQFYANRYGEMNPAANGTVVNGDAHVSFTPSAENRYYYHQNSYAVFSDVTDKNGNPLTFDDKEFGILHDDSYQYTYLTAADLFKWSGNTLVAADNALADDDRVYTYVEYYHKTNLTASTGELVYLLAYADWGELKESLTAVVLNGNVDPSGQALFDYVKEDKSAMTTEQLKQYILDNFQPGSDLTQVRARVAAGSKRLYRLHHMTVDKSSNPTGTATVAYAPTYNTDAAHVGAITVWLGNNGVLSAAVPLGITLSKAVTAAAESDPAIAQSFSFTITSSQATETAVYEAVRHLADGSTAATEVSFTNGVAKVTLKNGEMLYIGDMSDANIYTVTEDANAYYNLATINGQAADSITLTPQAAGNAKAHFVNTPKAFGNLTINKVINHPFGADYTVPLGDFIVETTLTTPDGQPIANQSFTARYSGEAADTTVTTDANGTFLAYLADGEQLTVYGLEEGTIANGRELYYDGTAYYAYGEAAGKWYPGFGAPTYWDSDDTANDDQVVVVANKTVTAGVINGYDPAAAEATIQLSGSKVLSGTGLTNWSFTFQLQEWDEVAKQWNTIATDTATNTDPTVSFREAMVFDTVGTYSFQVVEVNDGAAGVTYDTTKHTFTATVTDKDMDGKLEVDTVISDHAGTAFDENGAVFEKTGVVFTNYYQSGPAVAALDIRKILNNATGSSLVNLEGFQFGLYDSSNTLVATSGYTDASGEAQIVWELTAAGTYTYTLKEVNTYRGETLAGMTYGGDVAVQVVVVDNQDGTKSATVTYRSGNSWVAGEVPVTNTYAPTNATWTPDVNKVLTGRDMAANEFDFVLTLDALTNAELRPYVTLPNTSASNAAAKDGVAADVDFGTVTFSKVGTYYFTVHEDAADGNGVTVDNTVFYVRVDVTDGGNGALVATPSVYNVVGTGMTFTNTYEAKAVTYAIEATKNLIGRDLNPNEFTFVLTDGTDTWYASNGEDGSIRFPEITYPAKGQYTYTLTELAGRVPGVTVYDGNQYTVTVTVTDNGFGQLEASGTDVTAPVIFTNKYEATGSITLEGRKYVTGGVELDNSKFTFKLYASNANGDNLSPNYPDVATLTNGAFSFHFDYVLSDLGTHYYLIEETNGGAYEIDSANEYGIHYDSRQYLVAVTVTDNGDGTLSATAVKNLVGSNATYKNLIFVNAYEDIFRKEVALDTAPDINIDGVSVSVGDELYYTLSYYNGNSAPAEVTITDIVPNGTAYIANSATATGFEGEANGVLTWKVTVPAGERVEVRFGVKVEAPGADIKNQAVAVSGGNTYTSDAVVNYTYEKTVDKTEAARGEELKYEAVYRNNTGSAAAVTITDTLDSNLVYTDGSAVATVYDANGQEVAGTAVNGSYNGGVLTWTLPAVDAGYTVKVSFAATVSPAAAVNAAINNSIVMTENGLVVKTNTVVTRVKDTSFTVEKTQAVGGMADTDVLLNAESGDRIAYFITVKNTGETALENLVITDTVPAGLVVGIISDDGVNTNGVITWTIPSIPVGGEKKVAFTAEIPYVTATTTYKNVAVAAADTNGDGTPDPKESNEVVTDAEPPVLDVTVTKTQAVGGGAATSFAQTAASGDRITYTISVKNTGEWELSDILVKDTVPAGLLLDESSITEGGVYAGGVITWTVSKLAVDESVTLSFTAEVPYVAADTTFKNVAVAVYDKDHDGTPDEDPSNEVETEVEPPNLDVEIGKTQSVNGQAALAGGTTAKVGDRITYAITVKNIGEWELTNVVVKDTVPAGLLLDESSITEGGALAGGVVTWTLPKLAVNESVTLSFTVEIPYVTADTVFENVAVVVYDKDHDGTPEEEDSNKVETEVKPPVLSVEVDKTQSVNGGSENSAVAKAEAGDTVRYTITVTNTGEWELTAISVKDTVPAGLLLDESSITEGGVLADGVITWTVASLPVGESKVLTFTATVPEVAEATNYKNVAVAVYDKDNDGDPDEEPSNPVDIYVKKPLLDAEMDKSQSVNGGAATDDIMHVKAGDTISYFITVTNTGEGTLHNLVITDPIVAGPIVEASTITHGGVYKDGIITWTVATLPVGESITVSFDVIVPEVTEGLAITNVATLVYENMEEEPEEPSNKVEIQVEPSSPQTGDNSQLLLWFAVLFVTGGGLIASFFKKKRSETASK